MNKYLTIKEKWNTIVERSGRPNLNQKSPAHFKVIADTILTLERKNRDIWDTVKLKVTLDINLSAVFTNKNLRDLILDSQIDFFLHQTLGTENFWAGKSNYHGHLLNHICCILVSVASHAEHLGQIEVFGPYDSYLPVKIRKLLPLFNRSGWSGLSTI